MKRIARFFAVSIASIIVLAQLIGLVVKHGWPAVIFIAIVTLAIAAYIYGCSDD